MVEVNPASGNKFLARVGGKSVANSRLLAGAPLFEKSSQLARTPSLNAAHGHLPTLRQWPMGPKRQRHVFLYYTLPTAFFINKFSGDRNHLRRHVGRAMNSP